VLRAEAGERRRGSVMSRHTILADLSFPPSEKPRYGSEVGRDLGAVETGD
jgi:hypothetical protein